MKRKYRKSPDIKYKTLIKLGKAVTKPLELGTFGFELHQYGSKNNPDSNYPDLHTFLIFPRKKNTKLTTILDIVTDFYFQRGFKISPIKKGYAEGAEKLEKKQKDYYQNRSFTVELLGKQYPIKIQQGDEYSIQVGFSKKVKFGLNPRRIY